MSPASPLPDCRITVGLPVPWHSRYSLRPPPMSTSPANSPCTTIAGGGTAEGTGIEAGPEQEEVDAASTAINTKAPERRRLPLIASPHAHFAVGDGLGASGDTS